MCAMYYYASKLTAAALSSASGGGRGPAASGSGVCRCHEALQSPQQPAQQPPRQQQPPTTSRPSRSSTPTSGAATSEHIFVTCVETPRPSHYHRHRIKKVSSHSTTQNNWKLFCEKIVKDPIRCCEPKSSLCEFKLDVKIQRNKN